jgi:hypothetical protein
MCDECKKLEEKIGRYRALAGQIPDALTKERIKELIEELEQKKTSLSDAKLNAVHAIGGNADHTVRFTPLPARLSSR